MKILICEDNERKYNDIREAIRIVMPEAKITWCKYAKTGVQELKNNKYDFLIQDMQLPLHSDEEIMIKGVSSGFKAAYNTMIQQIDNGMTIEEIKAWAQNENKLAEIVDKNI